MTAAGMRMRPIRLGDVSYPYHYGHDCIDDILAALGEYDADRFLVVTDDNVLALHGEALLEGLRALAPVEVLSLPAGDGMKSLGHLAGHLERAVAAGATRRSVVIAFGGGVPGNLAGVLAALLYRGVRMVHVPTTTVAAMDSVISLKQAINSSRGKNHFGTYLTPQAVYLDVALLRTLPDKQLRSGLCEATKNCLAIAPHAIPAMRKLLADGDLTAPESLLWLLEESLAAKTGVTAKDAREQGSGLILEYGHTVGHAVELCDQKLRGAQGVSHGEAVMFGMLVAARIAAELGVLTADEVAVHDELARALGAPLTVPAGITVDEIMATVRSDNKRGYMTAGPDEAVMVLLRGFGEPLGSPDLPLVTVPLRLVEDVVSGLLPAAARLAEEVAA
ncbi:2-deoxy-scyllo-inosose synthase [Streptomyces triticiradicis]|uniref:2-deoxy-scyllo-inosose synthase n=1 Tax=Streptomyces triticiradicis TaxID=2651189 RepID=A0A7J5DPT1_9ACTN|nr:2-deoxy-scyllo-inosose synthase [Streptomyces triticiradicis]KAB1990756.1 iron-containing alcohol dehydrogenase [Streptomyces triticiradicis]